MVDSGIKCADDVVAIFTNQKTKKNATYLFFKLSENKKEIVFEKEGHSKVWQDFVDDLPPDEPRYVTYDFDYEKPSDYKESSDPKNKLIFIFWCPDTAKTMEKMMFTSSKDGMKKKLVGIATEIQANDFGDLKREEIIEKLERR